MIRIKSAIKIPEQLRNLKGFTFVEVMVTALIFTFLVAAVNAALFVGNTSWQTNSIEVELQQDLRQAMHWMKHSMQQTGSVSLNDTTEGVPINVEADTATYNTDPDCDPDADPAPSPACDPAYAWTTYTTFVFEEVDPINSVSGGAIDWNDEEPTRFVIGEDIDEDGNLDAGEDMNGNGELDVPEDANDNDVLDTGEDINGNGLLDAGAPFRRINGTTVDLIAENIESMQLRRLYDSSNLVEVILQAQKKTLGGAQGRPITLTLEFQFQMRN